jgi:hypothetical protein
MSTHDALLGFVRHAFDDRSRLWMDTALEGASRDRNGLLRFYTEASRRGGLTPARLPLPLEGAPAGSPDSWPAHWTMEDAVRAALLLERAAAAPATFVQDAIACYEAGDAREQQSWVRAVWVLPQAEAFLPLVIDACRTSILPLFESIACENPYPARYFPELNFNQLVLKSLFNGVPLSRIIGLDGRRNAELSRMAADYAQERRAASRSVPADIQLVTSDARSQEKRP